MASDAAAPNVSNAIRSEGAAAAHRIASLAIHSASTVALFLIETWQRKFPSRELPLRGSETATTQRS
jgi:hypothetical protein